jgi:hypothetical protein
MRKLAKSFILLAGILIVCSPLFAHHGSRASYDVNKQITMAGTVTEFVWSNPHSQIFFDVKDEKGNVVNWGAEDDTPLHLLRKGWTKDILKPGDQVTVTLCPSKAGTPRGLLAKLVLANGRVLPGLAPQPGSGAPGE